MKITGSTLVGFIVLLVLVGLALWGLFRWLKKSDSPGWLLGKWVMTAVLMGGMVIALTAGPFGLIIAIVIGLSLAIVWGRSIGETVAGVFTGLYDGGNQEVEPTPFYSISEAKRKQGRYAEAAADVRVQLAKFPTDFRGQIMLAEIQAEQLNDLSGAINTIERLVEQPGHSPKNIAFALNRTADWHLRYGQDPDSARLVLERIVERMPDTEFAQLALQRIAHLGSGEALLERQERRPIVLQVGTENIGLRSESVSLRPAQENMDEEARRLVQHLNDYPDDNDAREKLAVIYVDHYKRLDLAKNELEQLIVSPNQQPKHVVHWLNLLADLQIRSNVQAPEIRETLERIRELFPNSAAAENALNRIAYLNLSLRQNQKSQAIKLGSYEQNIGLKRNDKS